MSLINTKIFWLIVKTVAVTYTLLTAIVILCSFKKPVKPPEYVRTDIIFLKLYLNINPEIKFISGNAFYSFKVENRNEKNLPLQFDLSQNFNVKKVIYNGKHLNFKQNTDDKLIVYPNNNWNDDDNIEIEYEGIPNTQNGLGSVVFSKHDGIPVFWTLSEPNGAKDWFPCKQQLTDKIDSTDIIISCPKRYKSVSNGIKVEEKIEGQSRITIWQHRYPCAYYLLAAAISEYKTYSDYVKLSNGDSIEILNYVYPERYEQCRRRTPKLIPAFKMLCDSFGTYPFANEKYGHAQFGWGGGMEHQTISFMVNFDLDLMIHELAHHWFGNMITCTSWRDVWINEGFAVFCEGLATEKGLANGNDPVAWRKQKIYNACRHPEGGVYVTGDTTEVWNIFNTDLSYSKGAMILHMLRREMGDQMFFKAIRQYIDQKKFKYGNATGADFFDCIQKTYGKNLQWFVNQWYYGKGYPIYDIRWQQTANGILNLKLNQKTTSNSIGFFKAKIPLAIHGENGETMFVRLNNSFPGQHISIAPDFNVSYIVFDPYSDVISVGSRVQHTKLCTDQIVKIKTDLKSDKIRIECNSESGFRRYSLKQKNSTEILNGFVPPNGIFEIHKNQLADGTYILTIEGKEYWSGFVYIKHRNNNKKRA